MACLRLRWGSTAIKIFKVFVRVCGTLCSRFVCLDTQMRVHKVLIVDYCIGGKFSLFTRKNLFVVQGGRNGAAKARLRTRLCALRAPCSPPIVA